MYKIYYRSKTNRTDAGFVSSFKTLDDAEAWLDGSYSYLQYSEPHHDSYNYWVVEVIGKWVEPTKRYLDKNDNNI